MDFQKFTSQKSSPTLKTEQSICIYRSLQELNIIVFWNIINDKNPFLLDKDYTTEKQYTDEQKEYIALHWQKLSDDYFIAKDDAMSKNELTNQNTKLLESHKLNLYKDNFELFNALLDTCNVLTELEFLTTLKGVYDNFIAIESKTKIDYSKGVEYNYKVVSATLKALQARFNTFVSKEKKELRERVKNVYLNVSRVERILERSIGDVSKINVLQWLAYEVEAEEVLKIKKELQNKS